MADISSLYPQPQAPVNPLQLAGQAIGVKNALYEGQLKQQAIQQGQLALQLQNAKNKALSKLNDSKYLNSDSTIDANSWIADLAKDPETAPYVPEAINTRSTINAATQSGIDTQGRPTFQANQSVAASFNPSSHNVPQNDDTIKLGMPSGGPSPSDNGPVTPSANPPHTPTNVMSMPQGFTTALPQSRTNYDKVTADAANAPTQNAAYNEVINLANQGVLSGTNLVSAYAAAARNDPLHILTGATDATVKNQELQKWLSQGLLASGMPGSDARLQELQHGNLNPGQLTETIKDMAPFFKAVSEGTIAKQKYYNKVTDNGTNLVTEPHALERWNSNYDPRWIEFNDLDKKAQRAFLAKHPDLIEKRQQYHNLQDMGVIDK